MLTGGMGSERKKARRAQIQIIRAAACFVEEAAIIYVYPAVSTILHWASRPHISHLSRPAPCRSLSEIRRCLGAAFQCLKGPVKVGQAKVISHLFNPAIPFFRTRTESSCTSKKCVVSDIALGPGLRDRSFQYQKPGGEEANREGVSITSSVGAVAINFIFLMNEYSSTHSRGFHS